MPQMTRKVLPVCFLVVTVVLVATGLAQYRQSRPEQVRGGSGRRNALVTEVKALKARLQELTKQSSLTPEQGADMQALEMRLHQLQEELSWLLRERSGEPQPLFAPLQTNDNCANEINVTETDCRFTDTKNTAGATDETGEPEPSCAGANDGKSVWYGFTNNTLSAITVVVNTFSSSYDPVLAVYNTSAAMSSCDFANFTQIACDDDGGGGLNSRLSFTAQPGVLYKIQVTSFNNGSGGTLNIAICCNSCNLTPATAMNFLGQDHTVTAEVTQVVGTDCGPASGVTVNFNVTAGPNMGDSGSDTTDVNGQASFTYTGDGGAGTDTLQASGTGIPTSTASKTWNPCTVDGDCTPDCCAGGTCIPAATMAGCEPTAVGLLSFIAAPNSDGRVSLSWQTATEFDLLGFDLYRAKAQQGSYVKLNDNLILAESNLAGAGYRFRDHPGSGVFDYRLEGVNRQGIAKELGMVQVRIKLNGLTRKNEP